MMGLGYMFLLTLNKYLESVRGGKISDMSVMKERSSIFITFYRDGTIYFAMWGISYLSILPILIEVTQYLWLVIPSTIQVVLLTLGAVALLFKILTDRITTAGILETVSSAWTPAIFSIAVSLVPKELESAYRHHTTGRDLVSCSICVPPANRWKKTTITQIYIVAAYPKYSFRASTLRMHHSRFKEEFRLISSHPFAFKFYSDQVHIIDPYNALPSLCIHFYFCILNIFRTNGVG